MVLIFIHITIYAPAPAKAVQAPAKAVQAPAKAVQAPAPAKAVQAPAKAVQAPAPMIKKYADESLKIATKPFGEKWSVLILKSKKNDD